MAFDSSSSGQLPRSPHAKPPEAPRPSADTWSSLRDEGIQWEGQVLLVGAGIDIPALLVLTGTRLVLVSGGQLALEAPRAWLRPEPKLLSMDKVRISVTALGGGQNADDTDHLTIRVRQGRSAAAKLVSAISGRLVSSREHQGIRETGVATAWGDTVGAATPMALPPLPDFDDDPGMRRARRSWPPVEQHGVPEASPSTRGDVSFRGNASTSISSWAAANLDDTSAGAAATPPRQPKNSTWGAAVEAIPAAEEDRHQFNRGLVWGLRSLILAILIGTGVYFGRDSLPANFSIPLPSGVEQRLGLDDTETPDVALLPSDGQQSGSNGIVETPEATKADSDGTNGAPNSDLISTSDGGDDGLGGNEGVITPVNPGIGQYPEETAVVQEPVVTESAATEPESDVPAFNEPTEVPGRQDTLPETEVPATEPPATEAPATEIPATEAPATEAPATEIPVTEAPATEAPATEAPATEIPATDVPGTEVPVTEEPTETPATEVPATEEPATEAPATPTETATEVPATEEPTSEATLESQPPSVDPDSTPEQSLASGTFRYTITGASRGETIADLPELAATGTGEWVVLSMYGENWSDTEQVFDMSQFKLYADGEEVLLDVGNGWVGGQLGLTPAYGNTDAILWAAEEGHGFALTFLAPLDAQQLTLVAGDQTIDLSAALENQDSLAQDAAPANPQYIEATVVDVIDAETIVIEQDGISQTVRYIGLDVPTDDDCFADDATSANKELVDGKTVRIERQATDVDAKGNWVRDVWAPADDGRYFLVSEALVAQGAATVGISEPNTRFEGWLMGSQSAAKAKEAGLWGACDQEGTDASPDAPVAVAPTNRYSIFRRSKR